MVDTQFRVPPTLCKTLTLLFKLFAENILYQRAFWDFYSSVAKVEYDKWPNPAAWQETPQWLSSCAPWFLPSFTGLWLQMQNPVLRKGEKFCNRDFDLLRRTCDRISPISSVVSVVPVCAVSQQPHAHVKEEGEGGRINSQKPDVFEYEPKLGKKKFTVVSAIVTAQQLKVEHWLFFSLSCWHRSEVKPDINALITELEFWGLQPETQGQNNTRAGVAQ